VQGLDEKKREVYSPGKAEGNPQSLAKTSAVDEILAEGFSTSAVVENKGSIGRGVWANGEWSVVISRRMNNENGSVLDPKKASAVAFAVWQGAKQEVGARKCLTLSWVPLAWGN
jgi:DMSO reductase family type II enzyme heme b subunit